MNGVEILTDTVYKEGFGADENCQIYYTFDGTRFYRYENGKSFSQTIVYPETQAHYISKPYWIELNGIWGSTE